MMPVMDWATVATAVLGSGVVSAGVAYAIARQESGDPKDALALEREKFEAEQRRDRRQRLAGLLTETQAALFQMRSEDRRGGDFWDAHVDLARRPREQGCMDMARYVRSLAVWRALEDDDRRDLEIEAGVELNRLNQSISD